MSAQLIDGKAIAAEVRARVAAGVARLAARSGVVPGLTVILVGEDPASEVYVRTKVTQTAAAGMRGAVLRLPAETTEAELLATVARLNADPAVHGILVQFPLPAHLDVARVVEAIAPEKDVDGFNPLNVGRTAAGLREAIVPCTPLGVLHLIKTVRVDLGGLSALVVGASNVVGRPMARLLLGEHCTVSIAHVRTTDLPERARAADVLVVATGVPGLVRGDWLKPGATVIDVGITRAATPEGKVRLVGDVAFDEAVQVAGALTPVPGGVGPMTVAYLLSNTLDAAERAVSRR